MRKSEIVDSSSFEFGVWVQGSPATSSWNCSKDMKKHTDRHVTCACFWMHKQSSRKAKSPSNVRIGRIALRSPHPVARPIALLPAGAIPKLENHNEDPNVHVQGDSAPCCICLNMFQKSGDRSQSRTPNPWGKKDGKRIT